MTTKTKPLITPALSKRNRTFSSSRTAAAALELPPELFRLARVRGCDAAFDASNRVRERPFVEWLLIYLHDRHEVLPPVDDLQTRKGFFEPCDSNRLFNAPEATVRGVLSKREESFQFSRILWGDEWATRIAEEATELLKAYTKDCEVIKKRVDEVAVKHCLSLSLDRICPPDLDLSRPPFEILGLSDFGLWVESEKEFPRGPRYWHDPIHSWEKPIDLESKATWLQSRVVPCCILPDAEYQQARSDYGKRGYLLAP